MLDIPPPRATRDYLPEEAAARRHVLERFARTAERYGFEPVETPAFEKIELFSARSGPEIKSSMLTFHCDHEEFALRPELTAPICRLVASGAFEDLPKPHRLYYSGSCFRYCRPGGGRYREFTQAGIELLGEDSPRADAEVIGAARRFLDSIGVRDFTLRIGTVGVFRDLLPSAMDAEDRAATLGGLDHLASIVERCAALDESADPALFDELKLERMDLAEMQERTDYEGEFSIAARPRIDAEEMAERLPKEAEAALRRLWKVEGLVGEATAEKLLAVSRLRGAPDEVLEKAQALLGGTAAVGSLEALIAVRRALDAYQVGPFELVLGIARGLTFYTGTVFEITSAPEAGGRKYCGGGRYDKLVELFGGEPTPAVGCAFRFDALMDAFHAVGAWRSRPPFQLLLRAPDEETAARAVRVAEQLRERGFRVGVGVGLGSAAEDMDARRAEWTGAVDGDAVVLSRGAESARLPLDASELAGKIGSAQ